MTLDGEATYLVTGGLGRAGLRAASWLADRGARRLLLVDREAPSDDAVRALEARGIRVTVATADISVREDVDRVVASGLPLRGVVHADDISADGPLAPKLLGAMNLDAATRDLSLDFFVLFGAGAGLLGAPGQASTAAASTFIDALAYHRRALGLPALAVDWGSGSAEIETMLARLVDDGRTHAAVIAFDVRQWVELYPAAAASRMLARLRAEPQAPLTSKNDDAKRKLAAAAPGELPMLMREIVSSLVSQVLRIPEGELAADAPFTSLGMSSLMGMELKNHIEAELGIVLPATLLWTYPTVVALGEHLASQPAFAVVPPERISVEIPKADAAPHEDDLFALIEEELALKRRRQVT